MRSVRFLLVVLALAGLVRCSGPLSGPVKVGGYVYDSATGEQIDDYTMSVEIASTNGGDQARQKVDVRNGKFYFELPAGADYIVYVEHAGHRKFKSTNQFSIFHKMDEKDIWDEMEYLYNVALVPQTFELPEVSFKVVDEDGRNKGEGNFRVTCTGVDASVLPNLFRDGGDKGGRFREEPGYQSAARYWMPDAQLIAGKVNGDGTFKLEKILPGYNYEVTVFNVKGYRPATKAVPLSQLRVGGAGADETISLERYETRDRDDHDPSYSEKYSIPEVPRHPDYSRQ